MRSINSTYRWIIWELLKTVLNLSQPTVMWLKNLMRFVYQDEESLEFIGAELGISVTKLHLYKAICSLKPASLGNFLKQV